MSQKKSHEVDRWLSRPDPTVVVVLIYGPDRGLVTERGRHYAVSSGLSLDDPFSVIRLDADIIESDPGRLTDEAATISMFGGRRLVWIRGAGSHKRLAEAVKDICAHPPADMSILIEAGDLKKGVGLRSIVENAGAGMALPCYPDDGRAIDEVIDQAVKGYGLTIDADARQLLRESLGGDRLASRSEVEKLMLYCRGEGAITVHDVRAVVGNASSTSVDDVVDALLAGNPVLVDTEYARAIGSGVQVQQILSAALRQVQALEIMRGVMDREGRGAAAIVAAARPPIFFKRKDLFEKALGRLESNHLRRMGERLSAAIGETRKVAGLSTAGARQALLAVGIEAARAYRPQAK